MPTPGEKLAQSLEVLKEFQDNGIIAIKTAELSRVHRERLLKNGFIKEITRAWYIAVPHDEQRGDSTSWYTSFWHFCSRYLKERLGKEYCISAEQSMQIHAGNLSVPHQLIIRSTKATNTTIQLPHNTSLYFMKSPLPAVAEIVNKEGIQMLSLPSALIHCSPSVFTRNSTDVRTALAMIKDSSDILRLLLEGGHSVVAGRLAGAFKNIRRDRIANDILKTMKAAGYDVREADPFDLKSSIQLSTRERSPHVNRIKLMWKKMRETVVQNFPKAPGLPKTPKAYLKKVEEIYVRDAYHSLSIEKYQVSPEMIERVRSGKWNLKENEADRKQRNAMAARGYWLASQALRKSIKRILKGENAGIVADENHGDWYRELFAPSVVAGLLKPSDLAGYRNNQVYISQSKHVPVNKDGVRDVMPILFELLEQEKEASVRAVLGHFIFVYTHPYMDGNGRMGRFLMNAMLASGGYPWTIIPVEERDKYMNALESASVDQDIEPFSQFIAQLVEGMES